MFDSIDEALKTLQKLARVGDVESKLYRAALVYLKGQGYVMSGVGLTEIKERWNYRTLRSRIHVFKSLALQDCDRCIEEELIKGWGVPALKKDVLTRLRTREGIDKYLF